MFYLIKTALAAKMILMFYHLMSYDRRSGLVIRDESAGNGTTEKTHRAGSTKDFLVRILSVETQLCSSYCHKNLSD
jgi:hypothetical protein